MDETAKLDDPSFADSSFADPGSVTSAGLEARATRLIEEGRFARDLLQAMEQVIVGQRYMLERLLIGLLAGGHVLLEGVPGLAKTLAVKTLARRHRRHVPAHPVHARPAARPTWSARMIYNPRDGRVPHQARARSSPTSCSPTRSTARPPRCRARCSRRCRSGRSRSASRRYPAARAVPRARDAEPDRAGGHLSAARGAGRPLHAEGQGRLSRRATRSGDHRPHGAARRRDRRGQGGRRRRRDPRARARSSTQIYVDDKIKDYIVDLVFATRDPQALRPRARAATSQYGASPRAIDLPARCAAKAHAFLRGPRLRHARRT